MAGQPDAAAVLDGQPGDGLPAPGRATAPDIDRDLMWHQAYMDVQAVLDKALGTEVEDGAGSGIAGDVALLAAQRDQARAEAADLAVRLKELADRGVTLHPLGGSSRKMGRDWARLIPGLQGRLVSLGGVTGSAFAWIDTRPERVPEQEAAGQLTFPAKTEAGDA